MTRPWRWLSASCAGALACSATGGAPTPVSQRARLPSGVAARVGPDEIAMSTVARIAHTQGVPLARARDRAVSDALFAQAARSVFANGSVLPVTERSTAARALLETLKATAAAHGPITDAEIAALTASRWQELDRPPSVRTTHAVVKVESPASDAKARALAERIHAAVRGITDPDAFMAAARAVPHEGTDVQIERLPVVTPDGRVYYPDGAPPDNEEQHFDPGFSAAANALAVGEISQPIKTVFGYHVILCEARFPEQRVPLEERRVRLQDQALKQRADAAKQGLLKQLNAAQSIQLSRAADDLTAAVQVQAEE